MSNPPAPSPAQPTSPSLPLQTAIQEPRLPTPSLPPSTTGTSQQHIHGLARAVSRALYPLTVLFETEALPRGQPSDKPLDPQSLERIVYASALKRLAAKIPRGAFVAEAGGFAAVACWEPMRVSTGTDGDGGRDRGKEQRPLFTAWSAAIARLKAEHLYPRAPGGRYWQLSLMARDPDAAYVAGAVRAVLVPFMRDFASKDNGPVPVWLEAGSPRARDVYAHYGFRVVGVVEVGGIEAWGMPYTGDD
ncbi:hypothetical protein F5B20DRAFT_572851 [Whalleya microplaca]|nr:hypothetical protein F5B20DRAFT_572851 [Whalleya microplaca]